MFGLAGYFTYPRRSEDGIALWMPVYRGVEILMSERAMPKPIWLEWGAQGCNPRFVLTNLDGPAQPLYDELYCQRGEAENRIKEAQVRLFATRTSCHVLRSNQLRMLRPRDEPVAFTLNFIQRMARAMTQKWPATQAVVGVVIGGSRSIHLASNAMTPKMLIEPRNSRQSGPSIRTVVAV